MGLIETRTCDCWAPHLTAHDGGTHAEALHKAGTHLYRGVQQHRREDWLCGLPWPFSKVSQLLLPY